MSGAAEQAAVAGTTAAGELAAAAGPPLALIASVARNGVIGNGNQLAWDEPADKRYFRQQTLGCPVIMGRRTWDSLPARFRPLPGRPNIVLTRQMALHDGLRTAGAQVAGGLSEAIALARQLGAQAPRVFVIGGGELYAQALPLAAQLLLTEIEADLPGDTRFPDWPRQDFMRVSRQAGHSDGPPACAYAFAVYQRHGDQGEKPILAVP